MDGVWQLKEAKDNLGEIIEEAIRSGPQVVKKHGQEVAIIISITEYRNLMERCRKLSTFFRESPLAEAEMDLPRDKSGLRHDFAL